MCNPLFLGVAILRDYHRCNFFILLLIANFFLVFCEFSAVFALASSEIKIPLFSDSKLVAAFGLLICVLFRWIIHSWNLIEAFKLEVWIATRAINSAVKRSVFDSDLIPIGEMNSKIISEASFVVNNFYLPVSNIILHGSFLLMLALLFAFSLSWLFFVVLFLFAIAYWLSTPLLAYVRKQGRLRLAANANRFKLLDELFHNLPKLYSSGLFNQFLSSYQTQGLVFGGLLAQNQIITSAPRVLLDIIVSFGVIFTLFQGEVDGGIDSGILFSGLFICYRSIPSLQAVATSLLTLSFSIPALASLLPMLKEYPDEVAAGQIYNSEIESCRIERVFSKNLSYRLSNGEYLFSNVNFDLIPGDRLLVSGPSGSGKSTAAALIAGCRHGFSGNLLFQISCDSERSVVGPDDLVGSSLVGFAPQRPSIFEGTVRSNLVMFASYGDKDPDDSKLLEILELVQFQVVSHESASILDHAVSDHGRNLSGGQAARLGLAQVLAEDPDVLVLDEVTAGLDRETELAIFSLIPKLDSKIVIFVSHASGVDEFFNKFLSIGKI